MPPVDLENLVPACAGGGNDSKVACETLADETTDDDASEDDVTSDEAAAVNVDPELPPESFWLSRDAEYDWFDRNTFFERKDSGRGSSNLNAADAHSNSNSQRFSVSRKSKAAMIGLPKTQKATYVDPKRRPQCKPANVRLFPKRSEPVGKSAVPVEPGSPKVSCMGRVRSKRCRRRSGSSRRRKKPVEKSMSGGEMGEKQKKAGFYSKMIGMFRSKRRRNKKPSRSGSRRAAEVADEKAAAAVELQRCSVSSRVREIPGGGEGAPEPPCLGGMNRFASGRRSGSWAAEDFGQAVSSSDRHVGVVSWS